VNPAAHRRYERDLIPLDAGALQVGEFLVDGRAYSFPPRQPRMPSPAGCRTCRSRSTNGMSIVSDSVPASSRKSR